MPRGRSNTYGSAVYKYNPRMPSRYRSGSVASNQSGTSRSRSTYNNRRKKRYYSNSKKKLFDKKINTTTETRIVEIVKKEIAVKHKNLLKRTYIFCRYNSDTNEFTITQPLQTDNIDWDGRAYQLRFPKIDVETRLNQPELTDVVESGNVNEALDNDGTNQLMIGDDIQGYRWGDVIYIDHLIAKIRVRSLMLDPEDENYQHAFGSVKIKYAFVVVTVDPNDASAILLNPTPKQMLRMDPFGFSPKLDVNIANQNKMLNKKVLIQGTTTVNMNNDATSEQYFTIKKKLEKPLMVKFDPEDQNGIKCDKQIWFVARSTCPVSQPEYKPSLFVCALASYYEP